MKNSSARSNSRIIYLSVGSMLLGVLFIDIYGIIVKFLGDTYSTNQMVLFRNMFAIIPLLALIFYTNENLKIFNNLTKRFVILCFIRGLCFLFMNVLMSILDLILSSLINLFLFFKFAPTVFNTNLNLKGSKMMLILSKSNSN